MQCGYQARFIRLDLICQRSQSRTLEHSLGAVAVTQALSEPLQLPRPINLWMQRDNLLLKIIESSADFYAAEDPYLRDKAVQFSRVCLLDRRMRGPKPRCACC